MKSREKSNCVAIIGCQQFSAENLYSFLMNAAVGEIVLIGESETLLEKISDFRENIPIDNKARIFQGDLADAARAEIVVIATGTNPEKGESPLQLLSRNAEIIGEIAENLTKNNFNGVVLITTNPVDILAQVFLEKSGLPANKIIGSGKTLNIEKLDKTFDTEAEIEQSLIATWCAARTAVTPLIDFCQPNCSEFGKMLEADKQKPVIIEPLKKPALFTVGTCVARICEAILRDERTILPVSAMTFGQYGISGVFMNLPCIIRRDGVEDIIQLKISEAEKNDLIASSEFLRKTYKNLEEKTFSGKLK